MELSEFAINWVKVRPMRVTTECFPNVKPDSFLSRNVYIVLSAISILLLFSLTYVFCFSSRNLYVLRKARKR